MGKLLWYWNRLHAMSARECVLRVQKLVFQWQDRLAAPVGAAGADPGTDTGFPLLPPAERAHEIFRQALEKDAREILAGHWTVFEGLKLQVDDPPQWDKDYLANIEVPTRELSFKLNHRSLPKTADIKLIWELSRWNQMVRLAQAAYVLHDAKALHTVLRWLDDWCRNNPTFQGWNWTSPLETGLRLIQYVWIDALLDAAIRAIGTNENVSNPGDRTGSPQAQLQSLRQRILAPHVYFTWRYRSLGSSANNHLMGELAGVACALARWPKLAQWAKPLEDVSRLWQRETLAQFASDGGNREQALNYHLFSFELCWQARAALLAAGMRIAPEVEERLQKAIQFYATVQSHYEPWDYGDSDSAHVTPFFVQESLSRLEWRLWMISSEASPAITYWMGAAPAVKLPFSSPVSSTPGANSTDWTIYRESGMAVRSFKEWFLRCDISPLGYLSTAAHGHLDALHLSVWHRGQALIIDPGTGAYYGDKKLRQHLASWKAHNGPHLNQSHFPRRLGPFLWAKKHERPECLEASPELLRVRLALPSTRLVRSVLRLNDREGWMIEDQIEPGSHQPLEGFSVHWQFAPGTQVKALDKRFFILQRNDLEYRMELEGQWSSVILHEAAEGRGTDQLMTPGICSPGFRQATTGPWLQLKSGAATDQPHRMRLWFEPKTEAAELGSFVG
jgi:hypothetical protein